MIRALSLGLIPLGAVAVGAGLSLERSSTPAGPVLAIPSAPVVRLEPGCAWGTGSKALAIKRQVGQSFNLVNLSGQPRTIRRAAADTAAVPVLTAALPSGSSEAWTFTAGAGHVLRVTTCSGTVTLAVTITPA